MKWIYRLTRLSLGTVFIIAGGMKLGAPEIFAVLIEAYGIVPENLLIPVAVILPALEVSAGIGLLFDIEGSLATIAGLTILFIGVLGYGIWMGLDVDCGCFGPQDPEAKAFHGLWQSLYRDLAILAAIVFIYGMRRLGAIHPLKTGRIFKQLHNNKEKKNAYG